MKVERIYGLARKFGYLMLIATPILLNLGWWVSYAGNKNLTMDVDTAVDVVRTHGEKVSPQNTSFSGVLPLLNEASQMPTGYAYQDESAPISHTLGLYQGRKLGRNGTIPAYQRLLEKAFLSRLMVRMETVLKASRNNPDVAYNALKAYLMLGLPEHMDAEFVRNWVHEDWQQNLARGLGADKLEQLHGHLDALLELEPLELPFDLDDNLVMTVRDFLSRTTLAERIYTVIKSEHLQEGKPFTIAAAAPGLGVRVFSRQSGNPINQGVSAFFSPAGYQEMYLAAETEKVEQMEDEAWIFATTASGATQLTPDELKNQIRRRYFRDYTTTWLEFLEDVRIRPFTSLAEAAAILFILTGDESPLRTLLFEASKATRLAPEVMVDDEGDEGTSFRDTIASVFSREGDETQLLDPVIVDRAFSRLHKINEARAGGGPSPVDGLLTDLEVLAQFVDGLANSSQDDLATGLESDATNAIDKVRFRARRTPPPISGWVLQIASQSHNLVAGGATAAIRAAWSSDVAPVCRQTLTGRFPFANDTPREVQLRDFSLFFGPGGTIDSFFNSYLANFVDTTSGNWRIKSNYADSINISSSALRQIQRADAIKKAFFSGGGGGPSVSFVLRSKDMDKVTTDFMLTINDQTTSYDHGPSFSESFVWPGDSGTNRVQLQFNSQINGSRVGDTLDGPWALFRLLERSSVVPSPNEPEKLDTRFTLGDRWIEYEVISDSAYNPFSLPALRQFRCPDQL
jgi:type VI secretion system protein ImpL